MTTNLLLVCPHAAGKSVIAATYFQEAVSKLGLDASVRIAGTDPDDSVMDNVRAAHGSRIFIMEDGGRAFEFDSTTWEVVRTWQAQSSNSRGSEWRGRSRRDLADRRRGTRVVATSPG